ncbi:MAG: cadherin-like domain-containing protein [Halofilum sp. (in: g-proteobacteria)]|nr:cadherin-like domain-containing protein [Halofilum sp. (in: g-proteobacteria)]
MSSHHTEPSTPLIRALEPRLLFDGAALGAAADVATDQAYSDPATPGGQAGDTAPPAARSPISRALDAARDNARGDSEAQRSAIFIDGGVEGHEALFKAAREQSGAEVHVIDPAEDGFANIADVLADGGEYDSVQIMGHGDSARLSLGSSDLGDDNLADYADELGAIGDALGADGDLLLYGCNIAEGPAGRAFVDDLSVAAGGVDIAASNDDTGAAALGGNWTMEVTSGEIDTPTLNAQGFNALLAAASFSQTPSDQTIDEDNSLDFNGLNLQVQDGDNDMVAEVELINGTGGIATDSGGDPFNRRSVIGADLAEVNTFLDSLVYEPAADATDQATIEVRVDQDSSTTSGFEATTTFNVAIDAVADRPELSGDTTLDSVDEDSDPPGEAVSSLVGSLFDDADGDNLAGIAISADASAASEGLWQYQVDGSMDWNNVGTVASNDALLLADNTRLRFEPAQDFNGAPGDLTIHAVDDSGSRTFSSNTNREKADVDAAASTDIDDNGRVLQTTIDPVNDEFTEEGDGQITVDEGGSTTIAQADLEITDPDIAPNQIIFTLDAAVPNGTIVVNGTPIGNGDTFTQADINAGLVDYNHDGSNSNDVSLEYSVTDATGDNVAQTGRTLAISVGAVNNAPTISVPGNQTIAEDTSLTLSAGDAPMIADPDAAGANVDATISAANGGVTLSTLDDLTIQSGTNGTGSVTVRGVIADINTALDGLEYAPDADFNGSDTITIDVDDLGNTGGGGNQTATESIAVTVTAVADTPETGSATLAAVDEDTAEPAGATVIDLLANFDDADGDGLAGLAISADASTSSEGEWQFSLDSGENWTGVGGVSSGAALALDRDTLLRFLPAADYNGDPGVLTVHAVDDSGSRSFTTDRNSPVDVDISTGADGGQADIDQTGTALDTTINPIDDPAEVVTDENLVIDENNTGAIDASVLEITDVETASGDIEYTIKASNLDLGEGTLFLDANSNDMADSGEALSAGDTFTQADIDAGNLQFTHEQDTTSGQQSFDYDVSIGLAETLSGTVTIDVAPINDPPVLNVPGENDSNGDPLTAEVARGDSLIFGATNIEVFDVDNTDDQLIFLVEALPSEGVIELDNGGTTTALAEGSTFDATRINDLVYDHDGSAGSTDSFQLSLRDGAGATIAATDIDLDIVDAPPSANENRTVSMDEDAGSLDIDLDVQTSFPGVDDFRINTLSTDLSNDGTLFVDDNDNGTLDTGETEITGGETIDALSGADLTFRPNENINSRNAGTLTFDLEPLDSSGNPLGAEVTTTIDITPVNDAPDPGVTSPTTLNLDEGTSATLTTTQLDADDVDLGTPPADITYEITTRPIDGLIEVDGVLSGVGGTFHPGPISTRRASSIRPRWPEPGGRYPRRRAARSRRWRVRRARRRPRSRSVDFTINDTGNSGADNGGPIGGDGPIGGGTQGTGIDPTAGDDPVTANPEQFFIDEDQTIALDEDELVGNDSGDPELNIVTVSNPTNGLVSLSDANASVDAEITFTPAADFSGTASFDYTVEDVDGESATTTVTLRVLEINDGPEVDTNSGITVPAEGDTVTIDDSVLDVTDVDDADDDLKIRLTSDPDHGQLFLDGAEIGAGDSFRRSDLASDDLTFEHDDTLDPENLSGDFDFTVSDGSSKEASGTFTIDVDPTNDPPEIDAGSIVTSEGGNALLTGEITADDAEDATADLNIELVSDPTHGRVELDSNDDGNFDTVLEVGATVTFTQADVDDGRVRYVHDDSETTSDSFDVRAVDTDSATSADATVNVDIAPINDDPTLDPIDGLYRRWTPCSRASA